MWWVEAWEREMARRNHEDLDWLNTPVRLPRVDPWVRPPPRRAEGLYFSQQIGHTNGAHPR